MSTRTQQRPVARASISAWVVMGSLLFALGCREEGVQIFADFPGEDHFIHSSFIQTAAFRTDRSCIDLREMLRLGDTSDALASTGVLTTCEHFAGAGILDDLPDETLTFVAVVLERDRTTAMLAGCVDANPVRAASSGDGVVIPLSTTSYYNANYNAVRPDCPTAELECAGGCGE